MGSVRGAIGFKGHYRGWVAKGPLTDGPFATHPSAKPVQALHSFALRRDCYLKIYICVVITAL